MLLQALVGRVRRATAPVTAREIAAAREAATVAPHPAIDGEAAETASVVDAVERARLEAARRARVTSDGHARIDTPTNRRTGISDT